VNPYASVGVEIERLARLVRFLARPNARAHWAVLREHVMGRPLQLAVWRRLLAMGHMED
jgi:hypothetical protein